MLEAKKKRASGLLVSMLAHQRSRRNRGRNTSRLPQESRRPEGSVVGRRARARLCKRGRSFALAKGRRRGRTSARLWRGGGGEATKEQGPWPVAGLFAEGREPDRGKTVGGSDDLEAWGEGGPANVSFRLRSRTDIKTEWVVGAVAGCYVPL